MAMHFSPIIVAVLICGGAAASLRSKTSLESYTFERYTVDYDRTYVSGSQEYNSRSTHFQASLERVIAVNAKNAREGRAWTAGVHPFMDWSQAERQVLSKGYKPSRKTGGRASFAALQTAAKLNASSGGIGASFGASASWEGASMRQQGNCGSCWAISAAEAVEARLPGKERVAAQALVDCVPNPQHCGGKGGCDGATGELAYSFIRDHGIPLEYDYGYTAQTGSCPLNPLQGPFPSRKRVRVSGWTALPSNKAQPLMEALYNQGPVVVAVDANDWFDYSAGVFDGCKKDAELGHAVLAVGYGGEGTGQWWRIQNSWGGQWGEQGHIRMKRRDAAEEDGFCGQDRKPQDGLGCDGGPSEITVCGQCGILFDPIFPTDVHIEDSASADAAAASATSPAEVSKTYTAFKPAEYKPKPIESADDDFFKRLDSRSSSEDDQADAVVFDEPAPAKKSVDPVDVLMSAKKDSFDDLLSPIPADKPAEIFHPAKSAAQVKNDMEKDAVDSMKNMLFKDF